MAKISKGGLLYSPSFSKPGVGGYASLITNWLPYIKLNGMRYSASWVSGKFGSSQSYCGIFLLESKQIPIVIRILLAVIDGLYLRIYLAVTKEKLIHFSGVEWPGFLSVFVSNILGSKSVVYIVDDVVSHLENENRRLELWLYRKLEKKMLASYVKRFTISATLSQKLELRSSLDYTYVALPYCFRTSFPSIINTKRFNGEVVFLGSISYLIEDVLIEFMNRILADNSSQVTLKIVSNSIPGTIKSIARTSKSIYLYESVPEKVIGSLISSESYILLPYSFNSKYSDMVSTSFPSKFLKMMEYGDKILSYGPAEQVIKQMPYSSKILHLARDFRLSDLFEIDLGQCEDLAELVGDVHSISNFAYLWDGFND